MIVTAIRNINTNIAFREAYNTSLNSSDASLMVQSPYAALSFAREKYISRQAGSVKSNPIKSLGYKLYRTFGYLTDHEPQADDSINVVI